MGGSSSKIRRPCLWQVTSVNEELSDSSNVPLWGSVAFPNPRTGTAYTIGPLFGYVLQRLFDAVFEMFTTPKLFAHFGRFIYPWVEPCDT